MYPKNIYYRKTIDLKNKKFAYFNSHGKKITDKKILDYIHSLHIPPAYNNVEIDINPSAKIRVKAIDEAGRKQWLYNPNWITKSTKRKYCRLITFGKALPKLKKDIEHKLNNADGKDHIIALILFIIINCKFRIGNKYFKDNYNSYGITTLAKKHVKIDKNSIIFEFIGKKGVPNKCLLKNPQIRRIIYNLYKNKSNKDNLFTYENNGIIHNINSNDINNYLKQYGKFSSKDFRTWIANIQFLTHLKTCHSNMENDTEKKRKKIIRQSVDLTSKELHHTPAICRKSYINNNLINDYIQSGNLLKGNTEKSFVKYLEKYCKKQ